MATPQATRIGISGRGSRKRRLPRRAVGMESISLLAAKYEAKKMQRRIFEISIGWNAKLPKWIQSRAPLDGAEEERRHQQDAADQQQQVAVALEVAREAHHQQGEM